MGKKMLTLPLNKTSKHLSKLKPNHIPPVVRRINLRSKYGDDSVYFDLDDLENTVGSWEMYGSDNSDRYPAIQEEFFNRACQGLNRRDAMLAFCAISGVAGLLTWGAKGSRDAALPITIGPQNPPVVGPRDRI